MNTDMILDFLKQYAADGGSLGGAIISLEAKLKAESAELAAVYRKESTVAERQGNE